VARLVRQWACAAAVTTACALPAGATPDLSGFTPVLIEEFDSPFSRFDGVTGVWRDYPRSKKYVGNSPVSMYVNPTMLRRDGSPLGLNPFSVADGQLRIAAAPIPEGDLGDVRHLLEGVGYTATQIDKVGYYSGSLSTRSSWAQTYGYFEMRARLPEGRGHWPAFWLVPAVNGWPPEIDIFEVLGRENGTDGRRAVDNNIHLRVHFDQIAEDGSRRPMPTLVNPLEMVDGKPLAAKRRERPEGPRYTFAKEVDVGARFGRDVFDQFNVYALSWTPDEIVWWFGPTSEELTEVFRSPTPLDVNGPMSVVMNDQIGGGWARNPVPAEHAETFSRHFAIDYVKIYAMTPQNSIASDQPKVEGGKTDDALTGTGADQTFFPGAGFDSLAGGGGIDRFVIPGDAGSKILTDFGPDDILVLPRWTFSSVEQALERLAQVGPDVWLIDAQEPQAPQTLIFRNLRLGDLGAANFEFRVGG
jgi:Glycosyl hydrolases family 16